VISLKLFQDLFALHLLLRQCNAKNDTRSHSYVIYHTKLVVILLVESRNDDEDCSMFYCPCSDVLTSQLPNLEYRGSNSEDDLLSVDDRDSVIDDEPTDCDSAIMDITPDSQTTSGWYWFTLGAKYYYKH